MTEKLLVNTLCWSLTAGFPLWPAVVMAESDVPESVLQEPHTSSQTLVRFFGSVSYGWMDVCYPFRENFETYSKPEGQWEGFEEAIEEAKEFERTGQFIMVPLGGAVMEEGGSEDEAPSKRKKRAPAKRRRALRGSDDDENFGASSGDEEGGSGAKRGVRRTKSTKEARTPKKIQRPIRANKEQKLFAREIFGIVKQIEKAILDKNLDAALALLKKFDPKTVTKRMNKEGLTVDAPGPYALIDTQVIHISRLGKFVHGLSKEHENDILGPYSTTLYRHLRSNALRELALPDEVGAYVANQDRNNRKKATSSSEPSSTAPPSSSTPSSSMQIATEEPLPTSTNASQLEAPSSSENGSQMEITPLIPNEVTPASDPSSADFPMVTIKSSDKSEFDVINGPEKVIKPEELLSSDSHVMQIDS